MDDIARLRASVDTGHEGDGRKRCAEKILRVFLWMNLVGTFILLRMDQSFLISSILNRMNLG